MTMTRLLCTIAIIIASIYDLIAVQVGGVDISISKWFQTVGFAAPFQLIVLGYLLGHFFGFMPLKYRLFVANSNANNKKYYIITGHKPSNAKIEKAIKTDLISLEEIDPIIL